MWIEKSHYYSRVSLHEAPTKTLWCENPGQWVVPGSEGPRVLFVDLEDGGQVSEGSLCVALDQEQQVSVPVAFHQTGLSGQGHVHVIPRLLQTPQLNTQTQTYTHFEYIYVHVLLMPPKYSELLSIED